MIGHGGRRPGAGRKPIPDSVKRKARSVYLTDDMYEFARHLGNGNFSDGVVKTLQDVQRAECEYKPASEDAFDTCCGNTYYLYTEWSLAQEMEYGVKYCPFCGGAIREVR